MMNKDSTTNDLYYTKKQINELVSGDIVLHPIFRSDGLMLVNKNKELSDPLISMIRKHASPSTLVLVTSSKKSLHAFLEFNNAANSQFIRDSKQVSIELRKFSDTSSNSYNTSGEIVNEEPSIEEPLHEQQPIAPTANDSGFFTALLSNYPLWTGLDSKLESEHLKQRAKKAKQELLTVMNTDRTFFELFNRIKEYDDVLLIHSINTMCISLMIGLTLELSTKELFDLTVAALFSNVGFVEIEKQDFLYFLKTYDQIQSQIKRHLEVFSEMTVDVPALRKKAVVYGILDHHEYFNGMGYPNAKKGDEISLFGRILFIAHNYDELVGGYNYKIGLHPLEALRIIYENIDNKYDQRILNIFMHRTTYFKLGESLSLPNIQRGIIVGFDNFIKAPHLPIIKLESGQIIDMSK